MTGAARDVLAVTNCRLHPEDASLSRGAHLRVRNFYAARCNPEGPARLVQPPPAIFRIDLTLNSALRKTGQMFAVIRHNQRSEIVHIAGVAIYEIITSNFLADARSETDSGRMFRLEILAVPVHVKSTSHSGRRPGAVSGL